MPVPPGFHITTHAYHHFLIENHLADTIQTLAVQASADDPATLERASAQIQSLIVQSTIPFDIAALIREMEESAGVAGLRGQTGGRGFSVITWRTVRMGELVREQILSRDFYPPPSRILRGEEP